MNAELHHVSDAWVAAQRHREARDVAADALGATEIAILEDLGMTIVWRGDAGA